MTDLRAEARARGLIRYFTGKPCGRGHVAERAVSNSLCRDCARKWDRERYKADPEKRRECVRKHIAADPEKWNEYQRKRRAADPETYRERDRERYKADQEKRRECMRKHLASPLGKLRRVCVLSARRLELGSLNHSRLKLLGYGPDEYIAHLESTLPNGMTWNEARTDGYHVDHIVPLAVINDACPMGKAGRIAAFQMAQDLDNLQMLTGDENLSKHARFDTPEQHLLFDVLCSRYLE